MAITNSYCLDLDCLNNYGVCFQIFDDIWFYAKRDGDTVKMSEIVEVIYYVLEHHWRCGFRGLLNYDTWDIPESSMPYFYMEYLQEQIALRRPIERRFEGIKLDAKLDTPFKRTVFYEYISDKLRQIIDLRWSWLMKSKENNTDLKAKLIAYYHDICQFGYAHGWRGEELERRLPEELMPDFLKLR